MTETQTVSPVEQFQNFLASFQDSRGEYKYRQQISQLAYHGTRHLIVDFNDLVTIESQLAEEIVERPDQYLPYTSEAVLAQLRIEDPEYSSELTSIHVRFRNLPAKTQLRIMGADHINKLIMLDGLLVRATPVQPFLITAVFKCKCGNVITVEQTTSRLQVPSLCPDPSCRRTSGFELDEGSSQFINYHRIRVQERPEDRPRSQAGLGRKFRPNDGL